jgi:hypothetical protein
VKELILQSLISKGYSIDYTFDPMPGYGNEYFIYIETNKGQQIVFSNNKSKHQNDGAVIAKNVTKDNASDIVKLILEKMNA